MRVVGGLIEIAGIELNAIDALLYVWFVLAGLSMGATRDPLLGYPTLPTMFGNSSILEWFEEHE
jgi:hypothetical protein